MSFFTEPAFSSHIPSPHNPNAGMGEVAQETDNWPLLTRSSVLQGYCTAATPPFLPSLSTPPVASVPTGFIGTSFYPSAGLHGDGDTSDTSNAAAAAGPTGGQVAAPPASPTNWLKIGGIVAGTFLLMHMLGKRH